MSKTIIVENKFLHRSFVVLDLNKLNTEAITINSKIKSILKIGEDKLKFILSEDLSQDEEIAIDSFLESFIDEDPEQKIPLIYDLAKAEARNKHFHNIDYRIELSSALIPERESGTIKGEVREVLWYRDMVDNIPQTLVLKTEVEYFRDASGFATYRTTTRTYYNRDGSENPDTKVTIKYYFVNKQDMIDEGIRRRTLLVKSVQIPTMELIAEVLMPLGVTMENVVLKGRKFMDDYEDVFNKFKNNSSTDTDPLSDDFGMKNVIIKLRDESDPGHVEWMDKLPNSLGGSTSIRQHLMSEFSI